MFEPGDGGALRVNPETRTALLARRDPEISVAHLEARL
jgi:hypothetical protein